MRWLLVICVAMFVCSCDNKEKDTECCLGKYLYKDLAGTIHVDQQCEALQNGVTHSGKIIRGAEYIDTSSFVARYDTKYCTSCVSQDLYERLVGLSFASKMVDENIMRVYIYLVDIGYNMDGYDKFLNDIKIVDKRKRLYDTMTKEGFDYGAFDDFSKFLGCDNIE